VTPYATLPLGGGKPFLLINYALLFDYSVMPDVLRNAIGELRGVFAAGGSSALIFVLLLCIAARGFVFRRAVAKSGSWLAFLSGALLAYRSLKFLAVFGVIAIPVVYQTMRGAFYRPLFRLCGRHRLDRIIVAGAIACGLVRCFFYSPWINLQSRDLDAMPGAACEKLTELEIPRAKGRDHVRVLTHFNYGGWCRWYAYQKAPERDIRVTTDGRTQWVPPKHYELSFELFNVQNNWFSTLEQWDPDAILVAKDKALAQVLIRLPGAWTLAFHDQNFALFLPKRGEDGG
jgi:hypothetical protein